MMATKPVLPTWSPKAIASLKCCKPSLREYRMGFEKARAQRALCLERKKRGSASSPLASARARVWNSQI